MANPKSLKPYKPGQSGNPNGRPPNPPELKQIKQLSKGEFLVLLHKTLNMNLEDLSAITGNGFKGTVLEKWLASIVYHGIKSGDWSRLSPFIERQYGKVPDKLEINEFDHMSDEEIMEKAQLAIDSMKKKTENK